MDDVRSTAPLSDIENTQTFRVDFERPNGEILPNHLRRSSGSSTMNLEEEVVVFRGRSKKSGHKHRDLNLSQGNARNEPSGSALPEPTGDSIILKTSPQDELHFTSREATGSVDPSDSHNGPFSILRRDASDPEYEQSRKSVGSDKYPSLDTPAALDSPQEEEHDILDRNVQSRRRRSGMFSIVSAGLESLSFEDSSSSFDLMDRERDSIMLGTKQRKHFPLSEVPDSVISADIYQTWEKSRLKKRRQKTERAEKRANGQLKQNKNKMASLDTGVELNCVLFKKQLTDFLSSQASRLVL